NRQVMENILFAITRPGRSFFCSFFFCRPFHSFYFFLVLFSLLFFFFPPVCRVLVVSVAQQGWINLTGWSPTAKLADGELEKVNLSSIHVRPAYNRNVGLAYPDKKNQLTLCVSWDGRVQSTLLVPTTGEA